MLGKKLNASLILPAVLFLAAGGVRGEYQYDPADFATQVIEYVEGVGVGYDWISVLKGTYIKINDPNMALGRPTVDTTSAFLPVESGWPVVPVYPAFRGYDDDEDLTVGEIVTIGEDGRLTVKFDRKVRDNPYNPFGLDFTIFGNTQQLIDGATEWANGNPNTTTVGDHVVLEEPGIVSVSQDGVDWRTLPAPDPGATPPVYGADDFAPTLGRVYDDESPDQSLGDWNLWWGDPTDPTYPLDPALTPADLAGMTVAQIAQLYGTSAGGTGFDVGQFDLPVDPETGMKWIQYVRIENPDGSGVTPEIDTVSDVFARRPGDANLDGYVNIGDLSILGVNYGQTSGVTWQHADFTGDGAVNVGDLAILGADYGMNNGEVGLGGGGALPEPSTIVLLGLSALILRKHRH